MSRGKWTNVRGYKSYNKSYDPEHESIITHFYECVECKRKWYADKNKVGFLVCPYQNRYTKILSHIDITNGALGLEVFDGNQFSKR